MVVYGNIPIGCGMSSSTAFVICIVKSICNLYKIRITNYKLVNICHKIEDKALNIGNGLLDQYSILLSKKNKAMIIDFKTNKIDYISTKLHNCTWIIVNSKVTRDLSKSAYIKRVKECKKGFNFLQKFFDISSFADINQSMLKILKKESIILYNRINHVINENKRVLCMQEHLKKGAVENVGTILIDSHKSLRYLYEVSCDEIDYIIKISKNIEGWYGGRIIGGGFGGCCLHLLNNKSIKEFSYFITDSYSKKFNIIPEIIEVSFPGVLKKI